MKPFEYLPHKQPFMMLDSAEMIEEGRHVKGVKNLTINDPVVLPDSIMPDVYIIEAMAQLSGIIIGSKGISMLAALKNIKFTGNARTGDILEIESILEKNFGGLYIFTCKASVSGNTIVEGEVILHFDETT